MAEETTQTETVSKRCPYDGVRLVQQEEGGIMFWVCPNCGYEEPV